MSGIELDQSTNCNIYVEKGDFPFCGRPCENDNNCIDGQCNICADGVCKNEDSVSCSNYTCPDNKVNISNALCVGDSSTCNEIDCCANIPGGNPPPPGDDNQEIWGNILYWGGIVFIVIGCIGLGYAGVLSMSGKSNVTITPIVDGRINGGGVTGAIIAAVISICLIIGGSFAVYYGKKMIKDDDDS